MKDKCIVGEEIILSGNGVKITRMVLSEEAQKGLSTNGVKIPALGESKMKFSDFVFNSFVALASLIFAIMIGVDGIMHKHYVGIILVLLGLANLPVIAYHWRKYKVGC